MHIWAHDDERGHTPINWLSICYTLSHTQLKAILSKASQREKEDRNVVNGLVHVTQVSYNKSCLLFFERGFNWEQQSQFFVNSFVVVVVVVLNDEQNSFRENLKVRLKMNDLPKYLHHSDDSKKWAASLQLQGGPEVRGHYQKCRL